MKQNITNYSDQELSLLMNNDEGLYKEYQRAIRRNNWNEVKNLCDEYFTYSKGQLEELLNDFNNEDIEYENE